MAVHGPVWQRQVRRGRARQGRRGPSGAPSAAVETIFKRHGAAGLGRAWRGGVRQGWARRGMAGETGPLRRRPSAAAVETIFKSTAWRGPAGHGMARHRVARHGRARSGEARRGMAGEKGRAMPVPFRRD
jgi:hypothetical protein